MYPRASASLCPRMPRTDMLSYVAQARATVQESACRSEACTREPAIRRAASQVRMDSECVGAPDGVGGLKQTSKGALERRRERAQHGREMCQHRVNQRWTGGAFDRTTETHWIVVDVEQYQRKAAAERQGNEALHGDPTDGEV